MSAHVPSREDAVKLLHEYTKTDNLQKHAYAVEAVMRYMARKAGEDEEKWGVIGLVHDLDYEMYPDQHCIKTREILEQRGWPEEYIRAVVSHGWGICSDVEPRTRLEKTLYAIDELTGLVAASALVRPSKSVLDLNTKSVMKNGNLRPLPPGWTDRLSHGERKCSVWKWRRLSKTLLWV